MSALNPAFIKLRPGRVSGFIGCTPDANTPMRCDAYYDYIELPLRKVLGGGNQPRRLLKKGELVTLEVACSEQVKPRYHALVVVNEALLALGNCNWQLLREASDSDTIRIFFTPHAEMAAPTLQELGWAVRIYCM